MEPGCTKTTDIEPCTIDELPKCSERCKSADTDGFSFHKGIKFQPIHANLALIGKFPGHELDVTQTDI